MTPERQALLDNLAQLGYSASAAKNHFPPGYELIVIIERHGVKVRLYDTEGVPVGKWNGAMPPKTELNQLLPSP